MNNFNESEYGYNKKEVNEFFDYVIKKTEENINIIRSQKDEIRRLQEELEKRDNIYYIIKSQAEDIKKIAEKEADHILNVAKDNASRIVNDALLRADSVNKKQEAMNRSIQTYKKKMRSTLLEQLDNIDEIEIM